MSLIWTKEAQNDFNTILLFIAKDSRYYAEVFYETTNKETNKLNLFPKMGRIVPEINSKTIREIIFGSYRIMYQTNKNEILILRIIHSATNFKKL